MFRFIEQLGISIAVPQQDQSGREVPSAAGGEAQFRELSSGPIPDWHVGPARTQPSVSTELKTHLAALWERGGLAILIVDRQGSILQANVRTWQILTGDPPKPQLSLAAYIAAPHRQQLADFLDWQFKPHPLRHGQSTNNSHDNSIEVAACEDVDDASGTRWLKIKVVSIGQNSLALTIEDTSQLRQLNQEKQTMQEQLRHVQRLELVNEWSAGMAHEFNNLLQVIEAYGAVIAHDAHCSQDIHGAVAEILAAARRGSTLVKRLLAFSRKSTLQFTRCNLVELVAHCVAIYRHALASQVTIEHNLPNENVFCNIDQTLIEQAVLNLCVNARDAMPGGGQIAIEVQSVALEECSIRDVDLKAGPYAMIRVSDSGVGIPPEMTNKIFEPFFTTKKVGSGTGLGLSLVRSIVWDHGGAIDVQSRVGEGSTFTIYLPL